jgi:hypothetical protein
MKAAPLAQAARTPTAIVASYRRSGTHLTIDSLLNNGRGVHPTYLNLDRLGSDHPDPLSAEAFEDLLAEAGGETVVLKTHAPHRSAIETPDETALLERLMADSRIVYVHRDPRDVMVSLWHYRLSFDPAYAKQATFSHHIRRNIVRWRKHVEHWLDLGAPMVRFEDWASDYERTLDRTLAALGLERRPDAINVYGVTNQPRRRLPSGSRWRDRLIDLAARLPDRIASHATRRPRLTGVTRRAGRVGDWRTMFSDDDRALVQDAVGDFLERLGYEPS